ncbi:pentapeptide repeat-containing protein [Sphaerospermopsis aphanizomenoides BCCUSP55]|uniref:pentapeptide repeat-containing protein n=1 Tax=Sphaerospermopsis aphanizomenoides TaxID=459663 RepID=UPI0019068AF1|nr:pentapeptide repeat-containing protein [Sphaerospermopsis aphanizomenoides]MBK1990714.1 pentapeptide repeat-containing protein [Sphaerospermopsis aphanizomenoides BCCUSP55]
MFFKRRGTRRFNAEVRRGSLCYSALSSALLCVLLFLPLPAFAAQPERTTLTLELLQERIKNPTLREGNLTIDLQRMVIDLRPENGSFRDNFYQFLRKELQKNGAKPLGLDLSYSLIQGDFIGSDLGLRTPLYAQAIAPIFTVTEQEQLEALRLVCLQSLSIAFPDSQDCKSLLGTLSNTSSEIAVFRGALSFVETRFNGEVQFPHTFFLQSINAQGASFLRATNWNESRFGRSVKFDGAAFKQFSNFQGSIFFEKANFKKAQFQEFVDFQGSFFIQDSKFNQSNFQQTAKFNNSLWQGQADFSGVSFANQAQFNQADFYQIVIFSDAIFQKDIIFRETQFNESVDFYGTSIRSQADFSDALFVKGAFLNVSGLNFNSNQAKILGNPGEIGNKFSVPKLQGNQNILRNLDQNFRQQQQIADANQLEYVKQRLKLIEFSKILVATNINNAAISSLINLGFSPTQAQAIKEQREIKLFRNSNELLTLADMDLETYQKLSDRLVAIEPLSVAGWLVHAINWLLLSMLLLLSGYGTNFWLVFGVGGVAIAYFGFLFWLIDRYRRLRPVPIIPALYETISICTGFCFLTSLSLLAIFRNTEQPWLTLGCLFIIIVPVPFTLLSRLYQQGRYHDLMDISYFTEDGTLRQLRLLIGRLPVIPRNPTFRERYMPLLWDKRWNWLNYYDFSLNNLVRLGFNDIRLRDEHLPGIVATLAWYQWSLGLLYITLVLWTLSRTIPGLNLLIYLK